MTAKRKPATVKPLTRKLLNVPTSKLIAYSKNTKIHPQSQIELLAEEIKQVGFVKPIMVDEKFMILAGHGAWEAAKFLKMAEVPVVQVTGLSLNQKRTYVLADNKIAELSKWDVKLVKSELTDLKLGNVDLSLTGFLNFNEKSLSLEPQVNSIEEYPDDNDSIKQLKDDFIFPSDLPWGIPEVRKDKLIEIPKPLQVWAGRDNTPATKGTYFYQWGSDSIAGLDMGRTMLGFYVDDYRFERLWAEPGRYTQKILKSGITTTTGINFSLWVDDPRAIQLHNVFRARWMQRYFQEAGLGLLPDVNWADEKSFEYCLLGLPKNIPAFVCQLQNISTDEEYMRGAYGLKRAINELKPDAVLIYGSVKKLDKVVKLTKIKSVDFTLVSSRSELKFGNKGE